MIAEDSLTLDKEVRPELGEIESFSYDDGVVRLFALATMGWGLIAFIVGLLIALQLADWRLNLNLPWLTFGRLRPLHTNAAIFAFAGNAIFCGVYHSTQRLLKARMFNDLLSRIHFWGWQLIIVSAAITLPLGITAGKEYAELEWPIDIAITVVWVVFAVNFFGTVFRRRERHLYVAVWFYIATIVTVAILHIVNSIELPYSFTQSYPVYAGVQDALVQWWYGHNAVAFFLTTPFLGLMYYYIPKAVGRPVYSYRLSIIHFWALIFIYIWAGPHHLLNTAMPEWAQTLGMVFSVMLWAPSWGGMINGLLTLRGAWDRLRSDPVLKMFVAAVTFYGMATFEGPLLSIKAVNSLSHYTDWTVGHVHAGTLGWNGLLTFAMLYYLVPKLWNTKLWSSKLANAHFWLGVTGTAIYMLSLWIAGITQGLMWRSLNAEGKVSYEFIETVTKIVPLYWARALGGTLFIVGFLLMVWNLFKTIQSGRILAEEGHSARALVPLTKLRDSAVLGGSHRLLEGLPAILTVLSVVAISVGSVIEIVPALTVQEFIPNDKSIKPYTALELAGRDIYVREGCYTCHSQMIRPMISETVRYGEPSKLAESQYDRPFQWGSKRTGPDLAREGKLRPDAFWHYQHMRNPRAVVSQSIMPNYPWLYEQQTDIALLPQKLSVMKSLGVPYREADIRDAQADAKTQAAGISTALRGNGVDDAGLESKEIVALIAYLQKLGQAEAAMASAGGTK